MGPRCSPATAGLGWGVLGRTGELAPSLGCSVGEGHRIGCASSRLSDLGDWVAAVNLSCPICRMDARPGPASQAGCETVPGSSGPAEE